MRLERIDMSDMESMYLDILKGLAVHFDSRFVADIRETSLRHPRLSLGYALTRNQMTSKKWLVETLFNVTGGSVRKTAVSRRTCS